MAHVFNRAKVATATTGTGTITLGSAATGFLTFAEAGAVDGQTVSYLIEEGAAWEYGRGLYSSSGPTLTRDPIQSSNSDAAIDLAGSATVRSTLLAEDLDYRGVLNYGAVGDGVTDDSAAFDAAIAASSYVYVPYTPNGYLLRDELFPQAGTTIVFEPGAKLVFSDSLNTLNHLIQIQGDNVRLVNPTIDASGVTSGTHDIILNDGYDGMIIESPNIIGATAVGRVGIWVRNAKYCQIKGPGTILDCTSVAIELNGSDCCFNTIDGLRFRGTDVGMHVLLQSGAHHNLITDLISDQGSAELVGITYLCHSNLVVGCHANNQEDNGFSVTGYNNTVVGCTAYQSDFTGFVAYGRNNLFVGCHAKNCGQNGGGHGFKAVSAYGGIASNNSFIGCFADDDQVNRTQLTLATASNDEYTEWASGQTGISSGVTYRSYLDNLYLAQSSGTTGATPPVHTSGTASDDNVDWLWVNSQDGGMQGRDNYFEVRGTRWVNSGLQSSPALGIGSTKTRVANDAFTFLVDGIPYSRSAIAAGTIPGNDVVPQGLYGAVAFDIGTNLVVDAVEAPDNATGYATAAEAVDALPAPADHHVRMGYVTATKSDGSFTFGTTDFDAANTTVAYTNSSTVDPKPYSNSTGAPQTFTGVDIMEPMHAVFEDDFDGFSLNTSKWTVRAGSDTLPPSAALVQGGGQGGWLRLTTGTNVSTDWAVNGIQIVGPLQWSANQGSLTMEVRYKVSSAASMGIFLGFTDNTASLEFPIRVVAADAIESNATNAVGFAYDTLAATDHLYMLGVEGDTDATKQTTSAIPSTTFETLKIELTKTGEAFFFKNGQRIGSVMRDAVSPSALLCPTVIAYARGSSGKTVDIDYIRVRGERVSS
jgi:hypothetical protein